MSLTNHYRGDQAHITWFKERGGLRTPVSTKDTPPTYSYALDRPNEGEIEVLRSELNREQKSLIGSNRQMNHVSELGYEQIDKGIEFLFETGKLLYAVIGNCITEGTPYSPAKTGTISTGQGTVILTLSGVTLVVDAHIGDMVKIDMTGGVYQKYHIIDNDATTITLDFISGSTVNGKAFEIVTAPFTHTMTVNPTSQPSFAMRFDIPNEDADVAKRIIVDALGVITKELELTLEKGGEGVQSASFIAGKSIENGTAYSPNPSDFKKAPFKWCNANVFTITYNSGNPITANICDKIVINLTNDSEITQVIGDCYPDHPKIGVFNTSLTLHYFPINRVLYDLRNTAIANFLTDLNAVIKFTDPLDADRYIQFTYSKLWVEDHPIGIPSKDDAIYGVDAVFRLTGEGTIGIEEKNDLGIQHYEGSYKA